MKNLTYKLVSITGIIILVVFNVTQVHTKPGAPPSGGVSGDPARSTCAFIGCHPGPELAFNPGDLDINMGLTQGNLTAMAGQTYTPGQTYYIEFKPNVTNGGNTKYGFQSTSLDAPGNMAGAFIITDATHNSAQNLLSRNYIGHKNATSFHDWNFQWTAPATNVGDVTFYYAVDDADGNGNESGDKIYKGTTVLTPAGGTGIASINENVFSVSLFPNPVVKNLFVSFTKSDENAVQLNLYSADGRLIQTQTENHLGTGANTIQMNLEGETASGIYLLQLTSGNQKITRQIVVM